MPFDIPPCRVLVASPTYKHAQYLEARINSVFGQTWRDLHLLVVNDASPDNTAEVMARYAGRPNVTLFTRSVNSGSPFAAWRDVFERADCEYLWIAESDDRAEPNFLQCGLEALQAAPQASFYYTHSWVTNEADELCGHTINYLRRQFPAMDWMKSQKIDGADFNNRVQIYGNALPNMSSAVMRMNTFRKAFDPSFDSFRLAADWAFVGRLAAAGDVLFNAKTHNHFRKHQVTARATTSLERTCAEFSRAISMIGELPGVEEANTLASLERTAHMFLYERGSVLELAKWSLKFGVGHNVKLAWRLLQHLKQRPDLRERLRGYLAPRRAALSAAPA